MAVALRPRSSFHEVAIKPLFREAWRLRAAQARYLQNDLDRAFRDASRALELDPGQAIDRHAWGAVRVGRDDPRGALPELVRAVQLLSRRAAARCDPKGGER